MSRNEFLQKLKEALENDLSGQVVQEQIDYYNEYIMEEVRSGKSEEEVIDMLGDPWMLARTLIDSPGGAGSAKDHTAYEPQSKNRQEDTQSGPNIHVLGLDTWWKKLLLILAVVAVLCIVVAAVTGIISLLAPIVVPILLIAFVVRLIGGNRK